MNAQIWKFKGDVMEMSRKAPKLIINLCTLWDTLSVCHGPEKSPYFLITSSFLEGKGAFLVGVSELEPWLSQANKQSPTPCKNHKPKHPESSTGKFSENLCVLRTDPPPSKYSHTQIEDYNSKHSLKSDFTWWLHITFWLFSIDLSFIERYAGAILLDHESQLLNWGGFCKLAVKHSHY